MATIRLKREEALKIIKEARQKVWDEHQNNGILEGEELLEELSKTRPYSERLGEWYQEVAAGIMDGTITVNPTGSLKNAPQRPKLDGAEKVILNGKGFSSRWRYCNTVVQFEETLNLYRKQRDNAVADYDAQILLFELSADELIEIEQGTINKLLSGRSGMYGLY